MHHDVGKRFTVDEVLNLLAQKKIAEPEYDSTTDPGNKPVILKDKDNKLCFKLFFPCPGEMCSQTSYYWKHRECDSKVYINEMGFLLCFSSLNGKGCDSKNFIQKSLFKCEDKKHKSKYVGVRELSEVFLAIGNLIKSIDNVPGMDRTTTKKIASEFMRSVSEQWSD